MILLFYQAGETKIKVDGKYIDYDINDNVDSIRCAFNDFISEFSLRNSSVKFSWLSPILERNTLTHDLFRDVCFIHNFFMNYKDKELVEIYTSNLAIFYFFKKKSKVRCIDKLKAIFSKHLTNIKSKLILFNLVYKKLYVKFKTRNYEIKDKKNDVFFMSWINETCFSLEEYKDIYFDGVLKMLSKENISFNSVAMFYGYKSLKNTVNHAMNFDFFVFPEKFLSVKKIFSIFYVNSAVSDLMLPSFYFEGVDFTRLVEFYKKTDVINESYYLYLFFEELKSKDFSFSRIYLGHENLNPEKAVISGVRDHYPDVKIYAFFHTSFPKNLLNLDYCNKIDCLNSLTPDYILFNSSHYRKAFEKKYSKINFNDIYAFRQDHINIHDKTLDNYIKENVLIFLSGNRKDFNLIMGLLSGVVTDKKIIFRMHPMLKVDLNCYDFNFTYCVDSSDNISDALKSINIVISTYSAAALEAGILGCSVGLVYNKKELLMNPFDHTAIKNYQFIDSVFKLQAFLDRVHHQEAIIDAHYNIEDIHLSLAKNILI